MHSGILAPNEYGRPRRQILLKPEGLANPILLTQSLCLVFRYFLHLISMLRIANAPSETGRAFRRMGGCSRICSANRRLASALVSGEKRMDTRRSVSGLSGGDMACDLSVQLHDYISSTRAADRC